MRNWLEPFDGWEIEAERYIDAGDKVVVFLNQRGTARASGAAVDMRFGQLWSFKEGLVVRVQLFANPDEALAAAGIDQ
jgi:ketosteroid isomerase-like protein